MRETPLRQKLQLCGFSAKRSWKHPANAISSFYKRTYP
jgi:hypothetical protein